MDIVIDYSLGTSCKLDANRGEAYEITELKQTLALLF